MAKKAAQAIEEKNRLMKEFYDTFPLPDSPSSWR